MPYKLYLSPSCQEANRIIQISGHDEQSEEDIMQDLARDIGAELYGLAIRYNRPDMTLSQIVNDSNNWRPDFHLALHSNAGGGRGSEAWVTRLHHDNIGGAEMADLILTRLNAVGYNIRKGKTVDFDGELHKTTTVDNLTRFAEVDKTNAKACLIEICFHDSILDMRVFWDKRQLIIDAIADAILTYFDLK
jgi:N-acetylmuramoyl-L-alanine amidase